MREERDASGARPYLSWPQGGATAAAQEAGAPGAAGEKRRSEANQRGKEELREAQAPSHGDGRGSGQGSVADRWQAAVEGSGRGETLFPDNGALNLHDRRAAEESTGVGAAERRRTAVVGSGRGEKLFPDNAGLNLNDREEAAVSPSSLAPARSHAGGDRTGSGRGETLFPDNQGLNLNDRVEVVRDPRGNAWSSLAPARAQQQGQQGRAKQLQGLQQREAQPRPAAVLPVMTEGELKRARDGTAFPPAPQTPGAGVGGGVVGQGGAQAAVAAVTDMQPPAMSVPARREFRDLSRLRKQAAALGYKLAPATKEVESLKARGE